MSVEKSEMLLVQKLLRGCLIVLGASLLGSAVGRGIRDRLDTTRIQEYLKDSLPRVEELSEAQASTTIRSYLTSPYSTRVYGFDYDKNGVFDEIVVRNISGHRCGAIITTKRLKPSDIAFQKYSSLLEERLEESEKKD